MKLLKHLREMALKAGKFEEYGKEIVSDSQKYFSDATEITKLEGGKFSLVKKDEFYGLYKGDVLVGWVKITPRSMFRVVYSHIDVVYILPEFRKGKVVPIFLYALKEILDKPIMVDGAIFDDGEKLIDAIHKRKLYPVYNINKKTGDKTEYKPGTIDYDNEKSFFVIESVTKDGLYVDNITPGNSKYKVYFSRFEDLHDVEIESKP